MSDYTKADISRAEQLMDLLMSNSPSIAQVDLVTTYLLSMIIEHNGEEYLDHILNNAVALNEFVSTCNAPTHVEH